LEKEDFERKTNVVFLESNRFRIRTKTHAGWQALPNTIFLNTFNDGEMMIFFQELLKFLIQDSAHGFEYSEKF
jgi:hypothetical protein